MGSLFSPGRVAVGMLVAGACLGAFLAVSQRNPEAPPTQGTLGEPPAGIEVHVAGWVGSPGVVSLPGGSIVADAITAAGGFRAGAETGSVNLAAELIDGQQVIVPGPGTVDRAAGGAAGGDGKIALNRATVTELDALPGVGPVLAERIVAYREQNGPFTSIEDLLQVSGIGEAKLASIRDLVTVP